MIEANTQQQNENRNKQIIRASVIGILANILLAAFKAVMGLMSNSIAITLDAVNNLSDAASSVITIIGTKLAGKAPDKKHPFGHGRVEYLSAMVISLIVLYAGITSLTESIKKIIHPETPDYSPVILIIVAVAVAVKIILGRYVKGVGKKTNSESLINSGEDATLDAVISASTLAAAAIYLIWGIRLEAWLGAIISVIIIKSGIDMLRSTLSQILGERADAQLARDIRETITSFPEVRGAYDLILHNYGPDRFTGSVHIEVPDSMSMTELDELTRTITMTVYQKHDIILAAIGIYSINTSNPDLAAIRERVREAVCEEPLVREMHGFSLYENEKAMRFDLVISLDTKDRGAVYRDVVERVQKLYPDSQIHAVMDTDYSEE